MYKLVVNCLVENEEVYVGFAIESVINCVDHIYVCDAGSEDKTSEILQKLKNKYKSKITLNRTHKLNSLEYSQVRQKMLSDSDSEWIMILDGDEVWWNHQISKVRKFINSDNNYESIVVKYLNFVTDMYHVQKDNESKYKIHNLLGPYTVRFFRKDIQGIHVINKYPKEGFADGKSIEIQKRNIAKIKFFTSEYCYCHFTFLKRTRLNNLKFKYSLGNGVGNHFNYPEVFKNKLDSNINLWQKRSLKIFITSLFFDFLRLLKVLV